MKAISLLMTCTLLITATSFAQTATSAAPASGTVENTQGATANATTNTSTTTAEVKKSSILDSVILSYKSSNESGRFGFKDEAVSKDAFTGRVYKGKHEAKLGYKQSSGWGA